MRRRLPVAAAAALGLVAALLAWALALGARVSNHGPGLWTLRFERVIECALDYNGPPYRDDIRFWLTCGDERG